MTEPTHKRHDRIEGWLFAGRGSRLYDVWSGLMGRRLYRQVAADVAAAAIPGAEVLDVGTGTGHLLVELGRRREDLALSGIDLSPDMITLARRRVSRLGLTDRIDLRVGDVAALPY